ncbi:MAG: hypothetical protein JJ863_20400 [Deltaproteobacteria bacterium]|nr:hypothetical protein [Deltaproteobacteria bacterium]
MVGSHFENNRASNGGAIGAIHCSPDVYNSTFIDNLAEGIGGNEAGHTGCPGVGHEGQGGAGGLGGALYADGPEVDARETVLCGNRFVRNRANTLAGVIFRTPNRGVATGYRMRIDRCDFEDNSSALGGVSFIKDNVVTVRGSTFRGNRAGRRNDGSSVSGRFGGLWVNNGSFDVENSTFYDNLPLGLTVESGSAQVRNATLVGSPWNGNVTVRNGLIVNVSCDGAANGGSSVQWPSGSACVNGAMFRDPGLGELGMHGGPTPTLVPSNAEGLAVGSDCPERDQRGAVRSGCVVGAVDPG